MSLGSHGRREPVPSSDVDSGMAWRDAPDPDPISAEPRRRLASSQTSEYMQGIAAHVADCVRVIGWRLDPHGVTASGAFSASSIEDWRRSDRELACPAQRQQGADRGLDPARRPHRLRARARAGRQAAALRDRRSRDPGALDAAAGPGREAPDRLHARTSSSRAPGSGRGPSTSSTAGCCRSSTWRATRRSKATSASPPPWSVCAPRPTGRDLKATEARILEEAYELFSALRLEHQVAQLERGSEPDDRLDPKQLDPLTRRYLRDAFREVAAVQRSLTGDLARRRIAWRRSAPAPSAVYRETAFPRPHTPGARWPSA